MLMLQRAEAGAVTRLVKQMRDIEKRIIEIIGADTSGLTLPIGTDDLQTLSPSQLSKVNQIQAEIDNVLAGAGAVLTRQVGQELLELADIESQTIIDLLNKQIPPSAGFKLEFNRIPVDQIERMINTPLGGELYSDRVLRNLGEASRRVKASMIDSLTRGDTIRSASLRVKAILADTLVNRASTLVRTEYARVSTQANLAAMRQNKDFLKGFTWTATLDVLTCPICMGLHGENFPVDTNTAPPAHANCRCTMIPRLKTAKDLGIDQNVPKNVRNLFNGKPPDIPLSFDDFLASQTPEFRLQALGKARSELFDAGMSVKDMADDTRVFTLDEIAGMAQ